MQSGHSLQRHNHHFFLRRIHWFFGLCMVLPEFGVAAELQATDAWVRLAPPASTVNAAYLSLANPGNQPIVITQVKANCCAMAMLHQTRQQGETVSMVHVDQLEVPPLSSIQLKPGSLHIMLMQPERRLVEGDQVKLEFTLGDGNIQEVIAPVKASYEP